MIGDGWWQLIWTLACVVLVGYLAYLAARYLGGRWTGGAVAGCRIVGGLSLGGRRALVMVQLGERILVLGVTDQSVTRLLVLRQSEIPQWRAVVGEGVVQSTGFAAYLRRALGRRGRGASSS